MRKVRAIRSNHESGHFTSYGCSQDANCAQVSFCVWHTEEATIEESLCKMGRTNSPAVDDCSSAFRVAGAGESCRLLPLAGKVRVANTRTTLLRVRVQFQPQVLPVNVPEKSGHMFSRVPGCVTTSKESRRRKATILIMLEPMFHRTTRILRGHP